MRNNVREFYNPWNVDMADRWDNIDIFNTLYEERRPVAERAIVERTGILNEYAYSRYRNVINPIDSAWWLGTNDWSDGFMRCVERTGQIGARGVEREVGVRPYCVVRFSSEILPGEQVEFAGLTWTVLDSWQNRAFVLCDDIIARRRFDYDQSSRWSTSELRNWLEDWLEDVSI